MAWSAGRVAGHSVLDGIRAALALPEADHRLDTKVGGWGYSGGGQATAWAAVLQPSYAPELNVKGWVAGAFAGDLARTTQGIDAGAFAGFALTGADRWPTPSVSSARSRRCSPTRSPGSTTTR